jgi:hypothetical protein
MYIGLLIHSKYNNANYNPTFIFLLNLLQSHQEHNPYKASSFHGFVNTEPHQLKNHQEQN